MSDTTKGKQFSLKPIETQMLNVIQQQHGALLSNMLSFFAIERLAVTVDQNTAFQLNDDMTEVVITQNPPKEEIPPEAGVVDTVPVKEKK